MNNEIKYKIKELPLQELQSVNGGWGGGGSWSMAYRSHAMDDFFRGVYDGLSSMWK